MRFANYKPGRTLLCRLEYNSELVRSIIDFARGKRIEMAVFTVIGSVKRAKLACYNQAKREYRQIKLDKPLEIASCFGNLSLKDSKPFAHVHIVFADPRGQTKAGHLIDATVFAAELHLQELIGPALVREHDEVTDLALWKL